MCICKEPKLIYLYRTKIYIHILSHPVSHIRGLCVLSHGVCVCKCAAGRSVFAVLLFDVCVYFLMACVLECCREVCVCCWCWSCIVCVCVCIVLRCVLLGGAGVLVLYCVWCVCVCVCVCVYCVMCVFQCAAGTCLCAVLK